MNSNLKIARGKYKKGDVYYSASKNLKSKLVVEGMIHYGIEDVLNIYCYSGLLFDNDSQEWAIKI